MIANGIGKIAAIELPAGFKLVSEKRGKNGVGDNWAVVYSLNEKQTPSITSAYRGFPYIEFRAKAYRSLTSKASGVIYPDPENKYMDEINIVNGSIGNAGMNQLMDSEAMETMPGFHLEKISVVSLNENPVLQVEGWFHGPNQKFTKQFMGIFIDGSPEEDSIKIEELYLESEDKDDFERYKPFFEKSLHSISWR